MLISIVQKNAVKSNESMGLIIYKLNLKKERKKENELLSLSTVLLSSPSRTQVWTMSEASDSCGGCGENRLCACRLAWDAEHNASFFSQAGKRKGVRLVV